MSFHYIPTIGERYGIIAGEDARLYEVTLVELDVEDDELTIVMKPVRTETIAVEPNQEASTKSIFNRIDNEST